jgi:O-antigen ligase
MMVWPAVALLWRRGIVWGAMILLTVVAVMLNLMASGAAVLGVLAGGFTALVAVTHRKAGRVAIVSAMVLALAGMSLAAKEVYRRDWQNAEWLSGSARHRVDIWNNAARLIEQKPLTGWGFDAARAFTKMDPSRDRGSWQMMPLHPHNAPLQVLVELGVVGVVLVLGLLLLVVGRLEGLPKSSRVFGQALFASTLAIAFVAYGLWQNQWLAMIFSAALLVPLTSSAPAKPSAPPAGSPASGAAADGPSPETRR